MACFQKRSGNWRVIVKRKGHGVVTHTFDTKSDAEVWARQIEGEIDRGVFESRTEAENTSLSEALNRYEREVTPGKKSRADERYKIDSWRRSTLAQRSLASIHGKNLAIWRDAELKRGSASGTIRRKLAVLSHLFEIAKKEWGMGSLVNPVENIRLPAPGQARTRRLVDDEENRLLKAGRLYGGEIGLIIIWAVETAMRRGEIAAMRWEHLDRKARVLLVPETKTGTPRRVPLSTSAVAVLDGMVRRIDGQVWGLRPDSISQAFDRICVAARLRYENDCKKARCKPDNNLLRGLRFHDLRHEATSRLFEKGLNPMQVAAITGHKTLQMLKRYTHLRAEDLVALIG
ncbi:MAG: site-specific integrase [Acidiferrobacterales bacterium]